MNHNEITDAILKALGLWGRLLAQSKRDYDRDNPDHEVYYNANLFVEGIGKVWFGDIDLTKDSTQLSLLAKTIGHTIYVLKELDGRFDNENRQDYAKVAVCTMESY